MSYPKIIFQPMPLQDNIDLVKWAFFENNDSLDIYKYTIQYFPELNNIKKADYTKEEIYNLIEKIVSLNYLKRKKEIIQKVHEYNKVWNHYNNKYFKELCNYLNTTFPENIKTINAYVGLIPVFPRYLDEFSFAISPDVTKKKVIETCAHETCHFLWFTKWKNLYPNCNKEEFESPYLIWKYSEMVIDPILNNKAIKKVIHVNAKSYDSFYKLRDNDKYVMNNLKDIFNSNKTIEEKIQSGYKYICNYFNK